jgi:peptidoglycan glycosyltransferase
VNSRITRVAVVAVVMLGALIVGTTYWQTWAAAGLADRQDNEIQRVAQFTIKRGTIYANDGTTVLAKNRAVKVGGKTLYYRVYPQRGLTAHVVGYSTVARSQAGLEKSFNDYLTGANGNLSSVFRSTFDRWRGVTVTGNDVYTTINAKAQQVALDALKGQCGAAVALNPKTGATLVMASTPTYNPNLVEKNFTKIGLTKASCSGAAPLLNRATQGLFTPGSTFKIITAAAALDTGAFTPDSSFADPGYCTEYGKPVYNAGNPDQNGPESFGRLTLRQGFQHSVNSVFCNVGKKIGAGTILRYAKRFGFYSVPPFDTPLNERAPSGLYNRSSLFDPRNQNAVDPGRLAFGQERMLATPLQMAMVAGTVAAGGLVIRPYVVSRIVAPNGSVVYRAKPNVLGRAIKPATAKNLNEFMQLVVTGGTGTAAQIPGIKVAGKTGTAETNVIGRNTTWFVGFAPADNPRVAFAVVLENQTGYGGTTAAPIAKLILQALLPSASKP